MLGKSLPLRVRIKGFIMTTFEKLAKMYFKKTGQSPKQSFLDWLLSLDIEPTEKDLKKVLKNFNDYFD